MNVLCVDRLTDGDGGGGTIAKTFQWSRTTIVFACTTFLLVSAASVLSPPVADQGRKATFGDIECFELLS